MDFIVYDQSIKQNERLLEYIFTTLKENLSFIYGEDMINPESRQTWINNNLLNTEIYWRIVIAYDNTPCGFLIYTIRDNCLIVNDLEINKKYRKNPVLLRGLFLNTFSKEKGKWNFLKGYIHHQNTLSKKNFLKLASAIEERERGVSFTITKEEIQNRFLKTAEVI